MKTTILLCIGASLVYTTMALAADKGFVMDGTKRTITLPAPSVSLINGPGRDITSSYCNICHSLDYITTQQKFPEARWHAVVTKMVKTYGAPITEMNVDIITHYIATYYGTGK
ncbi:MAG: hypothetical protein PHH28_14605 [Desulfuromonadaceae bacterium]|nr:hypothetical protein [Desulfuromonadaceae bacterium]